MEFMRSRLVIGGLLLAAAGAMAQGGDPQAATQPKNGPAAQTVSPATTTPATPQTPPAYHPPQAKTQAEFAAYKAAAALTDPNQVLAAADQFAQKYPDSELRVLLYSQAMSGFAQQNNGDKLIEAGRKALAIEPNNPILLAPVAHALITVTHENDLDKEQRFAEAAKDARAAIDNINTGMHIPPNTPESQVQAAKNTILTQAYDTLGVIDMQSQNFADAEANFQKAAEASKAEPIALIYLRLAVAQDSEKKYAEGLANANKALQYAAPGSIEQTLAKQEQTRLQKLIEAGADASAPAPDAATPRGVPGGTTEPQQQSSAPADAAPRGVPGGTAQPVTPPQQQPQQPHD